MEDGIVVFVSFVSFIFILVGRFPPLRATIFLCDCGPETARCFSCLQPWAVNGRQAKQLWNNPLSWETTHWVEETTHWVEEEQLVSIYLCLSSPNFYQHHFFLSQNFPFRFFFAWDFLWKKLPSRELTYPPKMAFWRWFSFSQGGIC